MSDIYKKSIEYHKKKPIGKIGISLHKKLDNQEDLSLAYSPGVAAPCEEIKKDNNKMYDYTFKGNTVAIISDGSAVLGLGDIGPEASLPVMEGKSGLMKKFANIDSWPLVIQNVRGENGKTDVNKFCKFIKQVHPSFGGINLEDLAAPACFEIEENLQNIGIPVFHDDQHGTAIISLAGLINSLKITGKKIDEIVVVINGAGAAGIATARYYIHAGVKRENLILCDSKGVISKYREGNKNKYKEEFSTDRNIETLEDALSNADVFVGVSIGGILKESHVKAMNDNSVIFAMANPEPEIMPDKAIEFGCKIVATGRSDFPNQINNVLGFPGLFRGALDTRSSVINFEMKVAASYALADLACEPIPQDILEYLKRGYPKDYSDKVFEGENPLKESYIIPKPLDPRVVPRIARKVAEAAMETGVAKIKIDDLDSYEKDLLEKLGK